MHRLFAFVLVAVVVCWASPVIGAPGDIQVGLKGGLNLANMGGDDISGTDMKTGLGAGGVLVYTVSDVLSIQPEVLYSQKGFKETATEGGLEVTAKFKLNYVEVPLLAKITLPASGETKMFPHFLLGPAVAFEVGCSISGEAMGASASVDCDSEQLDPAVRIPTKSVDFGAVMGAGVDFTAGAKGTVTLDARFTLGFAKIFDLTPEPDVKNRNISIMVGYTFALGATPE